MADRIETALESAARRTGAWLARSKGDLDRALAETVTLAADDVLLDALLARLDPLARELLLGAAVYREPVDDIGLAWQVAEYLEPDRTRATTAAWPRPSAPQAGTAARTYRSTRSGIAAEIAEQWNRDLAKRRRPPCRNPPDPVAAPATPFCASASLHRSVPTRTADRQYLVHRWTATALADRTVRDGHDHSAPAGRPVLAMAGGRRGRRTPRADIAQLIEARHHYHEAGDLAAAVWWPATASQTSCTSGVLGHGRRTSATRPSTWLPEAHS